MSRECVIKSVQGFVKKFHGVPVTLGKKKICNRNF